MLVICTQSLGADMLIVALALYPPVAPVLEPRPARYAVRQGVEEAPWQARRPAFVPEARLPLLMFEQAADRDAARLGPRCCSSQQPAPARRCSSCGRAARLARRATRPTTTTTTTTTNDDDDDDDDDTNTHTPRVWLGASGASPPNHRFDGGFDADRLAH